MKIGFLIIDMQEIFLRDQVEKKMIDKTCEYINYTADLLRSKDHVVIHIQDIEGMEASNQQNYDFIPEIEVIDKDLKITKENSNAFWKTQLEQILLENGIDFLIISGFAAEYCVLSTYNGAGERGFKSVILQQGVLSTDNDAITSIYKYRNVISYPVVEYLVDR